MSHCSLPALLALAGLLAGCTAVPNAAPTPTAVPIVTPTVMPTVAPTPSTSSGQSTAPIEATPPPPQGSAEQRAWREDLRFLAEQLRTRHPKPFYRTSEVEFDRAVQQLDASIPTLTRDQIVVGLIQTVCDHRAADLLGRDKLCDRARAYRGGDFRR